MTEERDRTIGRVIGRGENARRVGRCELAHFDAALRGEHVLLKAPRGKLVEVALRILHRELKQTDAVMWAEVQRRRQEHALTSRVLSSTATETRHDAEAANENAKDAHWDLASGWIR